MTNIAQHLNECNTPSKSLLDAAIMRTVRQHGRPHKPICTRTASVMEVRNCPRNDCETGCGIPSPNETLIHAQSDTDNNSASSAVSSEVVEEKLKEKVAEFENSLRQKLQS